MSDFPNREDDFARREELSRAWAIVDNQSAEIEEKGAEIVGLRATLERAYSG
jgi:hypothetical protein